MIQRIRKEKSKLLYLNIGQALFLVLMMLTSISLSAQTTTVSYTSSSSDIPNPERGFYYYTITEASNYNSLDVNDLISKRTPYTPPSANYMVHATLVFRYVVLDSYLNSDIPSNFLDLMQADFDIARVAGVKLILRFTYTNTPPAGSCGSWICPPYGDADKSRVLGHIAQLKPLLQGNSDVIATLQMGFIGVWGEQYYTDHFGDASLSPFILTNTNWTDRNEVLEALLDAIPTTRTVQVRYPQMKQRYIYGLGSGTNSAALTIGEAYDGSEKSRIGFHNDCFLASDTDFGTYNDYGPPSSSADTANLKPYSATDTQFVPMGGETCSEYTPHDDCASRGGRADTEIERFHFSYLNSQFNNPDVNNDWTGVCLDEIQKKMGYRLLLIEGTYPNEAVVGSELSISFTIENEGYAAPFNPRGIQLVFRNNISDEEFFSPLDIDPRYWFNGIHNISPQSCIAPYIPPGNYDLLIHLPDPEPTLHNNPDYAIQLANQNMWESNTGYNDLNHTITITANTDFTYCLSNQMLSAVSIYDSTYCESIRDISGIIAAESYNASLTIKSDGTVKGDSAVIYRSGNQIELNSGFEVESQALFWAIIEDCNE